MNKNTIYGAILMTNSVPRYLAIALSTIASLAPFFVAWLLGVSLTSVLLGSLVTVGLAVVFGFFLGVVGLALGPDWVKENHTAMSFVLGYVAGLIGVSLFVGLSTAFLIVTTPLLFTIPMSFGLRAWATHKYQDSTLWESLS